MRSSDVTAGNTIYASDVNKLRDDAFASSWLLAHEQTSPDLTLKVENGTCYINNTRIDFAGGNSPSFTAPVTNPRIDILSLNSSGTLVRTAGTEAVSPSAPVEPTNSIIIAYVYNRVGQTSIKDIDDSTNGYVYKDTRQFLKNDSKNFESIIAEMDITTGNPVGLSAGIADRVARAFKTFTLTANVISPGSGKKFHPDDIIWLTSDTFIVLFFNGNFGDVATVVAGTVDRATMQITFGNTIAVGTAEGYESAKLVKLDTNKFACLSAQDGLNTLYINTFSISGVTITEQNATNTGIGGGAITRITASQLTTNEAVCLISGNSGSVRRFCYITWSSYTPTVVDSVNGFGSTIWAQGCRMAKIDTSKFILISLAVTSNTRRAICFSISGTITTGTELTISAPQNSDSNAEDTAVVSHATNRAFVRVNGNTANELYYYVMSISGTTISIIQTLSPTDSGGESETDYGNMIYNTATGKIIEIFRKNISPQDTRIMEITASDSSIIRKIITGNIDFVPVNNKFIIAYNETNNYWVAITKSVSTIGTAETNGKIFISGMSSTFLGFAQNTVSRGGYVKIRRDGDTNQTGLIAGGNYIVSNGGLVETPDVTGTNVVVAKSATEVLR